MWIVPPILISTYRCLYLYGHLCILHFCVLHCLKAKCCHYINYFVQNITILSSSKCAIVQIRNDSKIKFIVYCFIFVEIYLTSIMWMENRGGPCTFDCYYLHVDTNMQDCLVISSNSLFQIQSLKRAELCLLRYYALIAWDWSKYEDFFPRKIIFHYVYKLIKFQINAYRSLYAWYENSWGFPRSWVLVIWRIQQ